MKHRTKKLFSVLLLICMIVSMIPVVASAAAPSKVYLKPSNQWSEGNPRYAAYFWNSAGATKWVDAVAVEGGYYEVTVPNGFVNIIFCRMSPTATANNWNNKWNQTADLKVPTDGTNCYTVKEGTWDKGGGTWSTIEITPNESDPSDPIPSDPTPSIPVDQDFYLFGYINGANYGCEEDSDNLGEYKFVDGKVTATFSKVSYVAVKTGDNANWYMTDGWKGAVTSVTLYNTVDLDTTADKLMVPAGTVTLTLVVNDDGTMTLSYATAEEPSEPTDPTPSDPTPSDPTPSDPIPEGDYYLFGYINGASYGEGDDSANIGQYKFVDGKLTTTFEVDSYVAVKTGDNANWYMTKGWYGMVNSGILYDTAVYQNFQTQGYTFDKLAVPGGVQVTFTLVVNADNTVKLSYVRSGDIGYQDDSGIQNGTTLHAWNWSFNAIKENLPLIAAQGYTAVQTSPIQPVKEDTTGKDMHGVWWVQYQPVDFIINTVEGNPIGTASEFAAMCAEAEEYGIKIIVDVVANHMANHMAGNTLSTVIPAYIREDATAWHDYTQDTSDEHYASGDRFGITQYCMGGVPDLNTGSDKVQGYVLDFLKECIDAGADGFRFDGAKHIQTPDDDPSFASDFWPTVIGGAEEYAESLGRDVYFYGEVLDSPGQLPLAAYTKYMSVTDNSWGRGLLNEINGGSVASIANGYNKGADASQLVVWAECHDDFATTASYNTSKISVTSINKAWALIAARADVMPLYFGRPSDFMSTLMGEASITGWAQPEVKAVNLFHNAFVGQDELTGVSGAIGYVVRGNSGIVLVNAGGTTASVNISGTGMADGTYTDQISGNTFTVSGGKITGSIGSTGIAVVYNVSTEHVHQYKSVVTAPTCTDEGYTTYTCDCGDIYVSDKVAALGHDYVDGFCTRCGAEEIIPVKPDYYLFGYIDGANYGCEEDWANLGDYKFVDGKVTVTFYQDSYVAVKAGNNADWYMTDGWQGAVDSVTLYHTSLLGEDANKLMVPCGVATFTLVENEDGTLTLSYTWEEIPVVVPELDFDSATLSFEDEILVNLYYTISDSYYVKEQGVLRFDENPGAADFNYADKVYSGSDALDDETYAITTEGIAAKEMGDDRYYCVYVKLLNNKYYYSRLVQYSPKTYATKMLAKDSTSEGQKALCVAMLNYGAAAQVFFDYKADDLMNAGLTAEQKAMVEPYDEEMFLGALAVDPSVEGGFASTESGFTNRWATVSFEGAFAINYYFLPNMEVEGDVQMYYWAEWDAAGLRELTAENASGSITMELQEDGRYWAQVSGIAAKHLDCTYYVAGVYTDAEGNTHCTGVIAYSLSQYCINNAKPGKDMQALAAATAMYGYYAAEYFSA